MRLIGSIVRILLLAVTLGAFLLLTAADLATVVSPEHLFWPSLLGLGYEWIALGNALLVVVWLLSRHKRYALLPLAALLLSYAPLSRITGLKKADAGDAEKHLTVMTYNTFELGNGRNRQTEMLHYLKQTDADLLCLQEIEVHRKGPLTLERLKEELGYPYSYIDFKNYKGNRKYGIAVFSRYPLLNKQTLRYESESNISDRCDVAVGSDTFRLFNNHLQSYSFTEADLHMEGTGSEELKQSAGKIEQKMRRAYTLRPHQAEYLRKEIAASPYPVIVCGDFNDVPVSYVYTTISKGLKDAHLEAAPWHTGHTYSRRGIGVRIDYILHAPCFTAVECKVEETDCSDHFPVRATLAW